MWAPLSCRDVGGVAQNSPRQGRTEGRSSILSMFVDKSSAEEVGARKQQKTHFVTPFMHSCGHSASAAGTKEKGILAPHPLRPSVRSLFSGGAGTNVQAHRFRQQFLFWRHNDRSTSMTMYKLSKVIQVGGGYHCLNSARFFVT